MIYINADPPITGDFVLALASSPLVKDNILHFSKAIKDPNAHDGKETIYDIMLERNPSSKDPNKPAVGNLGSGSDFASFYQFVGVPSMSIVYMYGYNNTQVYYPVYHTQHDTFDWLKRLIDPKFEIHQAVTRLCGALLLHYADVPLMDMSVSLYAESLNASLLDLKKKENSRLKSKGITLDYLEDAVKKFQSVTKKFNEDRYTLSKKYQKLVVMIK